jgi:hypothetical protein
MNTVLKFDKCVLVKELNEKFKQVGDVFEVINVMEDSLLIRDTKTRVTIGIVSFKDFEKHFVRENNFKGWTNWTPLVGFDGQTDALYRTNHKKTQVKFITDKVRAEACCSKTDDFNLSFGIQIAYMRCLNKAMSKQRDELNEKICRINSEIADNESIMKKMINSLDI